MLGVACSARNVKATMRAEVARERLERLKPAIREVVEDYKRHGGPPVALMQMLTLRVRNGAAYRELPKWAQMMLEGYAQGYTDGVIGPPEGEYDE